MGGARSRLKRRASRSGPKRPGPKAKISISLSVALIAWIDELIALRRYESRSEAIERLLAQKRQEHARGS
ncbi:MAG: hypothetical protein C4339_05540 [Nitrososphaerota archaeon]